MTIDEQLQIEKKQDIVKILNRGLVELDFFTDSADISNGQVTSTYLNAYNKASIQIRNSQDIDTEIGVCGMGVLAQGVDGFVAEQPYAYVHEGKVCL